MKELSIEEKAKAYDEALERAEKALEVLGTDKCEGARQILSLFPELCESENEKIRRALMKFIEKIPYERLENDGVSVKDALAWLEKQGEQKPIINVPPREVILAIWDLGNEWKELTNGSISTEYGTQLDYIQKHWHESEYYLREKQGGQKPTDKVEPKFKVGDRITKSSKKSCPVHSSIDDTICEVTEVHDTCYILNTKEGRIQEPFEWQDYYELVEPAWSEEDEEYNGEDYGIDSLYHAQRILEKTLGKVDGYQTDDGILSHKCAITTVKKLYEQKPTEWGKEDKAELVNTIIMLKEGASLHFCKKDITKAVDWLKSIKQKIKGE